MATTTGNPQIRDRQRITYSVAAQRDRPIHQDRVAPPTHRTRHAGRSHTTVTVVSAGSDSTAIK
jgi:hypothetical protein